MLLLLAAGGDPSSQNNAGDTPLYRAVAFGITEVLRQILACGGVPDIVNKYGDSALHWAVRVGHHSGGKRSYPPQRRKTTDTCPVTPRARLSGNGTQQTQQQSTLAHPRSCQINNVGASATLPCYRYPGYINTSTQTKYTIQYKQK